MDDLKTSFLDAMSLMHATVTVVTTDGASGRAGATVSAVTSVAADGPAPMMLACVNTTSRAAAPILENRCFAINVLGAAQQEVADVFAGRLARPGDDRFFGLDPTTLSTGAPCLEGCVATFDCALVKADLIETHWVFLGAVQALRSDRSDSPLIYGDRSYMTARPL